jgi:hypothetical protein
MAFKYSMDRNENFNLAANVCYTMSWDFIVGYVKWKESFNGICLKFYFIYLNTFCFAKASVIIFLLSNNNSHSIVRSVCSSHLSPVNHLSLWTLRFFLHMSFLIFSLGWRRRALDLVKRLHTSDKIKKVKDYLGSKCKKGGVTRKASAATW